MNKRILWLLPLLMLFAVAFTAQSLPDLVTTLGKLSGVAAFITAVVNAGKWTGFVKDGEATTYVVGLNLLALIVLFAAEVAGYTDFASYDAFFAGLAKLLALILAITVQVGVGKLAHIALSESKLPVIGFSHSKSSEE